MCKWKSRSRCDLGLVGIYSTRHLMVLVGTMREVEAGNAHARLQQLLQHLHGTALRPQRADDLHSVLIHKDAEHVHPLDNTRHLYCPSFNDGGDQAPQTLVFAMPDGAPERTASRPSCTIVRYSKNDQHKPGTSSQRGRRNDLLRSQHNMLLQ